MDSGNASKEETAKSRDPAAPKPRKEWLPFLWFALSTFVFGSIYGMAAARYEIFPYPTIRAAFNEVRALKQRAFELDQTIALPDRPDYSAVPDAPGTSDSLFMVVGVGEDLLNFVRVIDRGGKTIHDWRPNWFDIWPEDAFVPADLKPKSLPGVLIHGAAIAPDGDLIFNFDHLSTVRLDPCGRVRWKLQNYGHHSVFIAENGDIWVSAERRAPDTMDADARPVMRDMTIQKLSPEGEILYERSLPELLEENGRNGLLHMINATPEEADTLHPNDVEVFPTSLEPGFFAPGDIMVSLRDVNTLLVLDPTGQSIKFEYTGEMLRQHDPDFTSGNTISVFDNHNKRRGALPDEQPRSRVLEISAPSGAAREVFGGGPSYYTQNMGMHQILPSGNLLVAVTWQGQLLEFAPDGRLAWQYTNELDTGTRGVVTEGAQLPPEMDAAFFQRLVAKCGDAR